MGSLDPERGYGLAARLLDAAQENRHDPAARWLLRRAGTTLAEVCASVAAKSARRPGRVRFTSMEGVRTRTTSMEGTRA